MTANIDLTIKLGGRGSQSALLGRQLEQLRKTLITRAKDLIDADIRVITEKEAEAVARRLTALIPQSLEKTGQRLTKAMFGVKPDTSDVFFRYDEDFLLDPTYASTLTKGQAGQYAPFWEGISTRDKFGKTGGYASQKRNPRNRRSLKRDEYFIYSGALQRVLSRRVPEVFRQQAPTVKVAIKKGATAKAADEVVLGTSYSIEVTVMKSAIVGRNFTEGGTARDIQDRLLARWGFSSATRRKLGGRAHKFRPTVLVAVRHWNIFTLPRLLQSSILFVENRVGRTSAGRTR